MRKRVTIVVLALILAGFSVVAARAQDPFPEPAVPDEWKTLDVNGLRELVNQLKTQGAPAGEQRALLGRYLAWKYMNDPADTRAVGMEFWQSCAQLLAPDLADATRLHWIVALRHAFAGTPEALAGLDAENSRMLCEVLEKLHDAGMPDLLTQWIRQSPNLETAEAGYLCWAAARISGREEPAQEARKRIVEQVGSRYLGDPGRTKATRSGIWNSLCRFLARDMSAETRSVWSTKLRGAFAANAADLSGVRGPELLLLSSALQQLGDQGADVLVANWVDAGGDLGTWDPTQICSAASRLKVCGGAGKAARTRLAQHLVTTRMTNEQATRGFGDNRWNSLVQVLYGDFSEETRAAWLERLRSAYVGTGDGLSTLTSSEIITLDQMFLRLNWAEFPMVVIRWASEQTDWQSWKPTHLLWLAGKAQVAGEGSSVLQRRLADHLISKYLKSASSASEVDSRTWDRLARYIVPSLPNDVRKEWALRLRESYTDDVESLSKLTTGDVQRLTDALRRLDVSQAGKLVASWTASREQTNPVPAAGSAAAIEPAAGARSEETEPLLAQLDAQWEQKFSEGALAWQDAEHIASAWLRAGKPTKARQWGLRTYALALGSDESRTAADMATMSAVAELLCGLGLWQKEAGYPAFAQRASELARQGKLPPDMRWHVNCQWGKVAQRKETRDTLEAALLDDEGLPRLAVAKILAWAYLCSGDLKSWTGALDARIAESEGQGDAHALWLLAKAQAITISLPNEPEFRLSRPWLDAALASAQSEPVRLTCLREFALHFIELGRAQLWMQVFESIQGQFGDQSKEALASTRAEVEKAIKAEQVRHEKDVIEMEIGQRRGRRAYLQDRLAKAQARGDAAAAAKIQAAIDQLTAELSGAE